MKKLYKFVKNEWGVDRAVNTFLRVVFVNGIIALFFSLLIAKLLAVFINFSFNTTVFGAIKMLCAYLLISVFFWFMQANNGLRKTYERLKNKDREKAYLEITEEIVFGLKSFVKGALLSFSGLLFLAAVAVGFIVKG